MFYLGVYIFKGLNKEKITPVESFNYDYVKELYEFEHVQTDTKRLRVILYAKYEEANLPKVMETQCHYLTMTQRKKLLKLLHGFEELFDGILGTKKTDTVGFWLKEDAKKICS